MGKLSVLIAEDDFLIREGLLRYLLEPDYSVEAVASGEEVVLAAREHKPDIALLDISLPGINGLKAARHVLQMHTDCKVLLISGYADEAYIEEARAMGASGYVFKTRLQTELLSAINTAISGSFHESKF